MSWFLSLLLAPLWAQSWEAPAPSRSVIPEQIELTFKPLDQRQVQQVLGKGKSTVWTVSLSNDYPEAKIVSRERIMRTVPGIIEIPGQTATLDLATRQAAHDPHTVGTRLLDAFLAMVASGATTYGLSQKQNIATGVGLGLTLAAVVRLEIQRGAPNPQPYFGNVLPDQVMLGPKESLTYIILANYDPKAQPILTVLVLP